MFCIALPDMDQVPPWKLAMLCPSFRIFALFFKTYNSVVYHSHRKVQESFLNKFSNTKYVHVIFPRLRENITILPETTLPLSSVVTTNLIPITYVPIFEIYEIHMELYMYVYILLYFFMYNIVREIHACYDA